MIEMIFDSAPTYVSIFDQDGVLVRTYGGPFNPVPQPLILEDGQSAIAVPRPPSNNEVWDEGAGDWRLCPERVADEQATIIIERHANRTQVKIWEAKEAEARAVMAGDPPGPILTSEAAATGIAREDIPDLAALVVRRADEDRTALAAAYALREAQRRAAKLARVKIEDANS